MRRRASATVSVLYSVAIEFEVCLSGCPKKTLLINIFKFRGDYRQTGHICQKINKLSASNSQMVKILVTLVT